MLKILSGDKGAHFTFEIDTKFCENVATTDFERNAYLFP